jgi:hypothetical protein
MNGSNRDAFHDGEVIPLHTGDAVNDEFSRRPDITIGRYLHCSLIETVKMPEECRTTVRQPDMLGPAEARSEPHLTDRYRRRGKAKNTFVHPLPLAGLQTPRDCGRAHAGIQSLTPRD